MANKSVAVVVRGSYQGKRVNWSLSRAKQAGLTGSYWIKWRVGCKPQWAGPFNDEWAAIAAQQTKKRELRSGTNPAPTDIVAIPLMTAVEDYLLECSTRQEPETIRRVRKELTTFVAVSKKQFLHQLTKHDTFIYINWLKETRKSAPRTLFNRAGTLQTFLKNRGRTDILLKPNEMPSYQEKAVDYYTEHNPDELKKFFAACDEHERVAFMFFLYSGCREKEVQNACWDDIDFVGRTHTVRPRPDMGFRTKNGKVRLVPLPGVMVDTLKAYVLKIPTRRLLFVNSDGGKQGHFLYICKRIAFEAGLNCGYCINKKGKSCAQHAVCANWSLHKFRRTFATLHLLNGMPITLLQQYIGHSDLETLNRYLAHISAKSDLAKQLADNMAKMVAIQGSVAADVLADAVRV